MHDGRRGAALVACSLALCLTVAGCSASATGPELGDDQFARAVDTAAPTESSEPGRDADAEVATVLEQVAAAFLASDPEALRPYLVDPGSAFGERWLRRAENLGGVPLSSYSLVLDPDLPDLATDRVRSRYDGDAQVRYVREEHTLEGFDASGPATEDLFLTFVETEDGWRISSDRDGESLGLISVDHLWDHGPVVASGTGRVVALHHPGTGGIAEVIAEAERALDQAGERWPLTWPQRVPVLVPADQDELAELLHVTFDLDDFIAFASATPTGELGAYELTGSRIMLNTPRFLARPTETRQRILVHELTHVATRTVSGPFVPAWLEEGVAQAVGEQRATTGLGQLDALVRDGATVDLPTDGQFTTGGRDRIFLSYQLGFSFVDHLIDRFGVEAVARFYAAAGEGAVGRPGTEAWHVDRAAREVLDVGLDELVADWREGF